MNVFQIDSSENFLDQLIDGIKSRFHPEEISKLLIILPSQRSCRLLEKKLIQASGRDSLVLPKIIPVGSLQDTLEFEIYEKLKNIPNSLGIIEAKFLLSSLIRKETTNLSQKELIEISSGLLRLVSKFEKEDKDISHIKNTMLGDVPEHVEQMVGYLKLISTSWPKKLSSINKTTPITRRNLFIKALSEKWKSSTPNYPVIIAGSTGSFSTTRILIKTISDMPQGNVILQGVSDIHGKPSETSPAFQLNRLLDFLEKSPNEIKYWTTSLEKQNILANILLDKNTNDSNIENMEYIECESSYEEALLISIKIRELLAKQYSNIGVVTSNKSLRHKIQNLLKTWNIYAELSDGKALTSTDHFTLLINIFRASYNRFSPESLLNVIKNHLCTSFPNDLASDLEIKYLRGIRKYRDLAHLTAIIKDAQDVVEALEGLSKNYIALESIIEKKYASIKEILQALLSTAESLSEKTILWHSEIGNEVYTTLHELISELPDSKIYIGEFENIIKNLLAEKNIFISNESEPKVQILTPIESRLLDFDYLIISSLNEKYWPEHPEIDPWISASSYTNLGFPGKQVKVGQSARDLLLLIQNKNILMTRSANENNTPQVTSRWITKIETWAKTKGLLDKIKPQNHYLKDWARKLNRPDIFSQTVKPEPKPPADLRPTTLSVTQIEKLMRDPYSVYAKKILNLKPLEPLDKKPNQLEFGNYVHYALDMFNKTSEDLMTIWRKVLNIHNPVAKKIWTPRFEKIAKWISEYEGMIRQTHNIETEIQFSAKISDNFTLTAKADRVERSKSGNDVNIIDFKTGSIPTQTDIKNGYSPQLTLEALLIKNENKNSNIEGIIYIQLGSGKKIGHTTKVQGDIEEILEATKNGIKELVSKYMDPSTAYLICPNPDKAPTYNEFEHLERLEEF